MGYSPPKKQLDLKEFLSTPAKKRPGAKKFGFSRFPPTPVKSISPASTDNTAKKK